MDMKGLAPKQACKGAEGVRKCLDSGGERVLELDVIAQVSRNL
jgi:hypothetical protein